MTTGRPKNPSVPPPRGPGGAPAKRPSVAPPKHPSLAPPKRPSVYPVDRRCPVHGFALSSDGSCMRCNSEGRPTRPGSEPLLAPTPLRTKLLFVLVAACVIGGALMAMSFDDDVSAGEAERGLVVEPGDTPPVAQPTEAERALAAARADNERRDREAAARRAAEEADAAERAAAPAPPSTAPAPAAATGPSAADLARVEAARASARARVPIILYGTSWCGACRQARSYMSAQGIAFTDLDVESNPAARATYVQLNPARTVPTLQVGREVMRGFSPESLEAALDQAVARAR
jgi:glutaredoxin